MQAGYSGEALCRPIAADSSWAGAAQRPPGPTPLQA